jgi:hypothetical protein
MFYRAFHSRTKRLTAKRSVLYVPVFMVCVVTRVGGWGVAGRVDYVMFMVMLFVEGRNGLC